jgi:RecA-family ATPase
MAEIARIDFPAADPLIENIVSANSAAVISGIGGIGKSNLSLNIALALSSPEVISFLGLAVLEQVNVLLVQAENPASDTKNRIEAMSKHPGFKAGWKHFYTLTHNLSDIRILDGDFNDDKFLLRVLEEIQSTNAGLLIIDPWISFHRGDENDNSAMRRTLDRLTLLMSLTGVAILLLHHVGKGAQDGSSYAGRGAMAVGDWCHNSFLLRVHDKKTNTLELSCQKARNFRKPAPILMKLNHNLVFERVEENGSVSVAFLHRFVVEAVQSQGGTVPTQKDLVDILVKKVPALNNRTKAHGVIRDAVQAGVIVEVTTGRKKSYQLPPQQQALIPVNQPAPFTP